MTRLSGWTIAGIALLFALVLFTLTVLFVGPDPSAQDVSDRLRPPGPSNVLGTDHLGRDVAGRVAWALAGSAATAVFVALVSGLLGGLIGVFSALLGGALDTLVQRLMDAVIAVPLIVVALAAVAVFGNQWVVVSTALAIAFLPLPLRVSRSSALSLRRAEFVDAARVAGAGPLRIAVRHIGVNASGPWAATVAAQAGGALLAESSLSFVGAGTGQSLGALLAGEAQAFMHTAPWLAVAPGAAVFLAAFAINLAGDVFSAARRQG